MPNEEILRKAFEAGEKYSGNIEFCEYAEPFEVWYKNQAKVKSMEPSSGVSNQSDLLPEFLYKDGFGIKIGYHGDTDVSKEWNDYLKKVSIIQRSEPS